MKLERHYVRLNVDLHAVKHRDLVLHLREIYVSACSYSRELHQSLGMYRAPICFRVTIKHLKNSWTKATFMHTLSHICSIQRLQAVYSQWRHAVLNCRHVTQCFHLFYLYKDAAITNKTGKWTKTWQLLGRQLILRMAHFGLSAEGMSVRIKEQSGGCFFFFF